MIDTDHSYRSRLMVWRSLSFSIADRNLSLYEMSLHIQTTGLGRETGSGTVGCRFMSDNWPFYRSCWASLLTFSRLSRRDLRLLAGASFASGSGFGTDGTAVCVGFASAGGTESRQP
jgi:hypothetical protein